MIFSRIPISGFLILLCLSTFIYCRIVIQPYNVIDPANANTSMYVCWKTTGPATIHYGVDDYSISADGDSQGVHLTDLLPNKRYRYIMVCENDTSVLGSFRTAPLSGTSFNIGICSDVQKLDAAATKHLNAMWRVFHPDMLIIVGDLINVSKPADSYMDSLFSHNPDFFANTVFVPVPGNHDFYFSTKEYVNHFAMLPDSGRNYLFKYGSLAGKVCWNSLQGFQALKSENATFKIGLFHYPVYLYNLTNQSVMGYGFDTSGCQAVYSGHYHQYYRSDWIQINKATPSGYSVSTSQIQTPGYFISCLPGTPSNGDSTGQYPNIFSIVTVDSIPGIYVQRSYNVLSDSSVSAPFDSFIIDNRPQTGLTGIKEKREGSISLHVAPNPFSPSVNIRVSGLLKDKTASLTIVNAAGRLIADLTQRIKTADNLVWDAGDAVPGLYVLSFKTGKTVLAKRMLLLP